MSEHELWNELGNLYFMTGAYKQASYAYNRSIQLENRYGRPYSNLAYSCVQQGKFAEAVDLYRSSIELLTDDREKAITWFRLGDVYRRLKDYRDAILAYQQADLLDPSLSQDETEVGKVLYGASNLTPPVDPAPIGPTRIEPVKVEPAPKTGKTGKHHPEAAAVQPVIAETVIAEPALSKAVIMETPTPELNQEVHAPAVIMEAAESLEAIEVIQPEINMDSAELPAEPAREDLAEAEEAVPDDWMLFTDNELPDETLTEWIATVHPEQEPEVTFPVPAENYPATNYSAASPTPTAEQPAYAEGKELMVIEKQPIPEFVVAVEEEEAPAPQQSVDKSTEEAPQAVQRDIVLEQAKIEYQITNLRRVVEDDPENARAWDDLGELYKSQRLYKDAIPAYQKAAGTEPKNVQYLYHLGCAYAIEGLADDAVKTFQQIIKLDSSHALAHATLGGYYRKMGLEELAQKHIGKAVKNFYDSENEYNRACLQALCGNVDDAIILLRTALQTEQTYVDWVLRDPDLDSIRNEPRFKQLISDFS